jgi:SnoaL-like domain
MPHDEFLDRYAAAWADPASGRLADLWADDCEMLHPELPSPIQGRGAVMEYLRAFLEIAPDLVVRPLAAAANGELLFVHFRAEATIGGRPVAWEGVDRFELESGRAVRGIGFFDTTAIRDAVAALRSPGPHA